MSLETKAQRKRRLERMQYVREHNIPPRVFDWKRAAQLLRDLDPDTASACLKEDPKWTGGLIWKDHKPWFDDHTFLFSNWATPLLKVDGSEMECWIAADDAPVEFVHERTVMREIIIPDDPKRWDGETKWPESAMQILGLPMTDK